MTVCTMREAANTTYHFYVSKDLGGGGYNKILGTNCIQMILLSVCFLLVSPLAHHMSDSFWAQSPSASKIAPPPLLHSFQENDF